MLPPSWRASTSCRCWTTRITRGRRRGEAKPGGVLGKHQGAVKDEARRKGDGGKRGKAVVIKEGEEDEKWRKRAGVRVEGGGGEVRGKRAGGQGREGWNKMTHASVGMTEEEQSAWIILRTSCCVFAEFFGDANPFFTTCSAAAEENCWQVCRWEVSQGA
eukprot:768564-Hanusia_phi.AAC.1